MEQYYARICWNTNGWRIPSGDKSKLEQHSFVAENGFGYEEWLFNYMWPFKGYNYAFLQPVHRSFHRMKGKTLDLLLWAIDPDKRRVQIGEIKKCEVLTDSESQEAIEHYRKQGRLKQMEEDIVRVGANKSVMTGDNGLFNIRFRSEHAVQYDDPLPTAIPTDNIAKLKRYSLVLANQSHVDKQWLARMRQGSTSIPIAKAYIRPSSQGCTVDPYHPVLQAELMKLLQAQFGKDSVKRETRCVDITVNIGKRKMLIEIKTDVVAKRAIREALGQILEYAYFPLESRDQIQTEVTELFIVAPGAANDEISAYLSLLSNKFHIPIRYCSFSPGSKLPEAFKQN